MLLCLDCVQVIAHWRAANPISFDWQKLFPCKHPILYQTFLYIYHAIHREPDVVHALRVYTTRVDTAFGVTFMAIAPDHPLAEAIAVAGDCVKQLRQFAEECAVEATQYGPEDEKPKRGMSTLTR